MFRIQLIVTGDMEKAALHASLQRLFPERRGGRGVEWLTPRMVKAVTSHQLRPDASPSEPMIALAKALLAEARRGKTGQPPDLVVAVDDVELGNLGREHIVVEHLRAAMTRVLAEQKDESARTEARTLVRDKCSFHLLCPMAESYFFGDAAALLASGVASSATPRLVHPTDVEAFETDDPAWLPICTTENLRRAQHAPWWRHECHPKHYLEHLASRRGVTYDETRQGRTALAGLTWSQVPRCVTDARLIRSLFEDLSAWFDVPNPLPGDTHPRLFPAPAAKPDDLILRNL